LMNKDLEKPPPLESTLHDVIESDQGAAYRGGGDVLECSPQSLTDEDASNWLGAQEDPRKHYGMQHQSSKERCESQSVRTRNFNSFAKAVLFERFLLEVRREAGGGDAPLAILDLGCGKGGDFRKVANCGVTEYCGVDVSEPALSVAVKRVNAVIRDSVRAVHGQLAESGSSLREVSLVHADCWREHLAPVWDTKALHGTARLESLGQAWFHLVSSQMACHYAFESKKSAEMMMRNVSERLCVGGVFMGTIPDASKVIHAQQEALSRTGKLCLGNSIYRIEFNTAHWARVTENLKLWESNTTAEDQDIFGVLYRYTLLDAVDQVYEPLVHFGTFVHMAQRHGLVLRMRTSLTEIVTQGGAQADTGRLRRLYFYKGGMNCMDAPEDREALQFYLAFAFQKQTGRSDAINCKRLASCLRQLHQSEGHMSRVPKETTIIHACS